MRQINTDETYIPQSTDLRKFRDVVRSLAWNNFRLFLLVSRYKSAEFSSWTAPFYPL